MNRYFQCFKFAVWLIETVLLWKWRVMPLATGLDISWVYGLNLFHEMQGIDFVRDIIFTYGPLGFLLMGQPFANHALYSFLFWGVITILGSFLIWYTLFSDRLASYNSRVGNVVAAFLLTIVGCKIFADEYVIEFIFILLLLLSRETKQKAFFIGSVVLLLLDAALKFNMAVVGIATMGGYFFVRKCIDKESVKQELKILALGAFCFIGLGYLIYGEHLIPFIKGVEQISSGYNIGMSVHLDEKRKSSVALGGLAILMLPFVIRRNAHNIGILVMLLMPFLGAYKHGIVLADDHIITFMGVSCLLLGQFVFWSDERIAFRDSCSNGIRWSIGILLVVTIMIVPGYKWRFMDPGTVINQTADVLKNDASITQKYDTRKLHLSDEFRSLMGDASYTVIPWELSVVQFGDNFIPLPVYQTYSAYTPVLDRIDAETLREKDIQYIFFALDTIDNRFPLIETPAIWKELFLNYEIAARDDKKFLLQRVEKDYEESLLTEKQIERNERVEIPVCEENEYIEMGISSDLNLLGKVAKIFYKIPEVNMEVEFTDGTKVEKRVLLDNLANDCLISVLPLNEGDFQNVMEHAGGVKRVKQIHLKGSGLKYYKHAMRVQFKKIVVDKSTISE